MARDNNCSDGDPNPTQGFVALRQDPPPNALLYLAPTYWDERFVEEEHYEWFKDYSHFRALILKQIKPTDRVLEVGAGSSRLSEEMYKDGIKSITCTDLSPIAVQHMRERFVNLPGMVAAQADMLKLPFQDQSFDVVIEKGAMGFGKAMLIELQPHSWQILTYKSESKWWKKLPSCGDPWNPKPEVSNRVHLMLAETHRVLTPTGRLISIAFGQPHFRRPVFEAQGLTWMMKYDTFGDSFHYFFYTLCKGTKDLKDSEPNTALSLDDARVKVGMEHEEMDSENFLMYSLLDDDVTG